MTDVTLLDGAVVDDASEAWRHECEARAICALPSTVERRTWLEVIDKKRGKDEGDRLRATIKMLWNLREGGQR